MLNEARQLQKAEPDTSSLALSGKLGKKYGIKFQREIDTSKARIARSH
jgi:hypothetical protein